MAVPATTGPAPLAPGEVVDYLVRRGSLTPPARSDELGGGVSNRVFAATGGGRAVVLKQALARLRVQEEWLAPPERVLTEADALRTAARLTPDHVPAVVDVDPDRLTLTIERAPAGWRDWRTLLLAGAVDPDVGRRLGEVLATWHAATPGGDGCSDRVRAGRTAFEALRLEPFFETPALREPAHAVTIARVADRVRSRQDCLVHGDFSPKNVLVADVDGPGPWVIDFEVAHVGDPHFDVAFLIAHLVLKAVHRPALAADYSGTATTFLDGYRRPGAPTLDPGHLSDLVACLVLARVRGKSPADYLTPEDRRRLRATALILLDRPAADVAAVFDVAAGTRP